MQFPFRRTLLALAAALPLATFAQAPAWPARPITLVVGSAPGGSVERWKEVAKAAGIEAD